MKKNQNESDLFVKNQIRHLFLIMKLVSFILFAGALSLSASSYSQNTKIDLNIQNSNIQDIIHSIENGSEFIFVYDAAYINSVSNKSISVQSKSISEVLDQLLQGTGVAYLIDDRQIFLYNSQDISTLSSPKAMTLLLQQSQKKELKGKVTDEKGAPLPGVSVSVKETTIGIITDNDGNFSLLAPIDAKTLVFSYIGLKTLEVTIGTKTVFNVTLHEQTTSLSEVVAIGYGSRARKDITTAISTISSEAIDKSNGMSAELAMQGTMTGVNVTSGGGDPMARPTIQIRGVNTWGVATPLYIIDGVPVTEYGAGIEGLTDPRAADVRGPLNIMTMVDPNDIESISVLKDASAAAIYGVRASNGVILITTKKGKTDKLLVEFTSRYGIQDITQSTKTMNTSQYTKFITAVQASDPTIDVNPDNLNVFNPSSAQYLGNSPTYNWQNAIKNKSASTQDNSVRLSGGNAKVDYFASVSSTNSNGAFKYNYLDRLSGSFKLNAKVNNWLKLGASYRMTSGTGRDLNPDLIQTGLFPAWQKIYDPNGLDGYASTVVGRLPDGSYSSQKLYGNGTRVNVLGNAVADDVTYKSMRNMGNIYVEVEPIKNLKIRGQMSMDTYNYTRYSFQDYDGSVFNYTAGDLSAPTGGNSVGSYEERNVYNNNYINEINVSYHNTFGKHNVDLVLNGSDQQYNAKYIGASTQWMQSKEPYMRVLGGQPEYLMLGSGLTNSALEGQMGRGSYNYNSTYYFDVTVRHDGSTRFAKNNRWGTFPSVSGAWRITQEKFMKSLTFLNDVKLRAGYGQLGNQEVQNMAYLSPINNNPIFAWGTNAASPGMGFKYIGAAVYSLANSNLQWEKTSTTNFGLDAVLLNSNLTVSLEYFNKKTDGILQTVTLPQSLGLINMPASNIASVKNSGMEFSANYNNKIGELKYGVGFNCSTVKNVVEKTSGGIPLYNGQTSNIEQGYSMNFIRGYKVGGIFQTQAQLDAWNAKFTDATYQTAKVAPGDFYYEDLRGAPAKANTYYSTKPDGKVDPYDQVYLGKTIPGYYYGVNLSLEYRNIDLSAQFTGVGDVQKVNNVKMSLYNVGTIGGNESVDVLNAWTPQNHSTTLPRVINGDPAGNYRFSSRFVENGAYLKLRTLQLGYTLPAQVYHFLANSVSHCRFYVGASNLFTITKYTGYDPENDNYPTPRTLFMGLNVRF